MVLVIPGGRHPYRFSTYTAIATIASCYMQRYVSDKTFHDQWWVSERKRADTCILDFGPWPSVAEPERLQIYWPCQIIIGTLRLLIKRFSGAARLLFFLITPLDLALSLDSDLRSLSSSLMCTNREKKDYSCMHTTLCCFITPRAAISPSCERPRKIHFM